MMLFDHSGMIKHYSSPEMIVAEFYELRLDYYEKRRIAMLKVSWALENAGTEPALGSCRCARCCPAVSGCQLHAASYLCEAASISLPYAHLTLQRCLRRDRLPKSTQVASLDQKRADNRIRFILAVVEGRLEVRGRKRADLERDLEAQGFDRLGKAGAKVKVRVRASGMAVAVAYGLAARSVLQPVMRMTAGVP